MPGVFFVNFLNSFGTLFWCAARKVHKKTAKNMFAKYLYADDCFVKAIDTINCDDNNNAICFLILGRSLLLDSSRNEISLEVLAQRTHLRRFAIDSTSKFHVEKAWRFHRFWKANPFGNYDIDLTWKLNSNFKVDEISMSCPRGFFYIVSMSNRFNCFAPCFFSIIFELFLLWEPILSYFGIVLSRCNFNDIT